MNVQPELIVLDLAATLILGVAGVAGAWWLRRRTTLSVRNLYPVAGVGCFVLLVALAFRVWPAVMILLLVTAPWVAGAVTGSRRRSSDLGAGEELRNHELARRWIWQPAPARRAGERLYLRSRGELMHERGWPAHIDYVSMTDLGVRGPRLPIGAGQHVVLFGATGAGKTTTARRLIAARTLAHHAALLVLDQKGDPEDVEQMRALAAAAGVPFILFDSQDPETDRWQPLWGTPDVVAARAVEPIKQSEPYYYDVLRRHLDVVCKVLHAAGMWPPSVPMLVDACLPSNYERLRTISKQLDETHKALKQRAESHGTYVTSPKGTEDLSGGAFRLEVALALAGRVLVRHGLRLTVRRSACTSWRRSRNALWSCGAHTLTRCLMKPRHSRCSRSPTYMTPPSRRACNGRCCLTSSVR